MFFCSSDGTHLKLWNQSFQRLIGYDKFDLLHKNPLIQSTFINEECKQISKEKFGYTSKIRVNHSNGYLLELLCHHDIFEDVETKQDLCFGVVIDAIVVDESKNWLFDSNGYVKESRSLDSVLQMHTIV